MHIHSNKGKHDFYLHFSGYESGELRQEEKKYKETAADRDWKRGKARKRLVSYLYQRQKLFSHRYITPFMDMPPQHS